MPLLTPEQKQQIFQERGINPQEWDIDDSGNFIPASPSVGSPSVSPQTEEQAPRHNVTTTPFEAGAINFAEAAPSAVVGGIGGAGGLALGTALSPFTGGASIPVSILLTLLGAGGAGALTRVAQKGIEPDSWKQKVATAQQEHPWASTIGELSTMPLGGFNPNPRNVVKAVGGLGKLISRAPMGAGEAANLINVGAGAGIGAGMTAGEELYNEGTVHPVEILKSAGLGALFNKPNPIGRRLGFHDIQPYDIHQELGKDTLQYSPDITTAPPNVTFSSHSTPEVEAPTFEELQKQRESAKTNQELAAQELEKAQNDSAKLTALEAFKLHVQNMERASKLEAPPVIEPKTNIETPEGSYSLKPESASLKLVSPEEYLKMSPEEREATVQGLYTKKHSSDSELPIRTAEQTKLLENENIPKNPTAKWFKVLQDFGVNIKGIKTDFDGNIVDDKGRPVAGQTLLEKGIPQLIKLHPEKMGADTPIHELYHAFVNSLRKSPRAYDRKLVKQYDSIVEKSADYQRWKAERQAKGFDADPEEYQATNAGFEFLNRHLNTRDETPLKSWFKYFGTYLKTRFGKHATVEDFQRLLDYRLTYETKPFSKYHGVQTATGSTGARSSTESDLRSRYDSVQDEIKSYTQRGLYPPQELLKEIESIKNASRDAGMPPIKTKQSSESELTPIERERQKLQKKYVDSTLDIYADLRNGIEDRTGNKIPISELSEWMTEHINHPINSKLSQTFGIPKANEFVARFEEASLGKNARQMESLQDLNDEYQNSRNSTESELKGEGKTPSPFKMEERIAGQKVIRQTKEAAQDEIHGLSLKNEIGTTTPQDLDNAFAKDEQNYILQGANRDLYKNFLNSRGSELTPANHQTVQELIKSAAEIKQKPEDYKEIRDILLKQVNWKKMPDLQKYIESRAFNHLNQTEWEHVQNIYDKYQEGKPIPEKVEAPAAPPIISEVKAEPTPKTDKTFSPSKGGGTIYEKPSDKPTTTTKLEEIKPEDLSKYAEEAKKAWDEVDNTRNPKRLAEDLRQQYKAQQELISKLQQAGVKRESAVMQLAERKLRGIRSRYDGLIDKRGIYEPPIDADVTEYDSDLTKTIMEYPKGYDYKDSTPKPDVRNENDRYAPESVLPRLARPEIDKIEQMDNPRGPIVAEAMRGFYRKRREYTGSLTNYFLDRVLPEIPLHQVRDKFFQDSPETRNVLNYLYDLQDTGASAIVLNPREQRILAAYHGNLDRVRALQAAHPTLTAPPLPADYVPNIPSRQVLDTILNHDGTPRAQALINDWMTYRTTVLGETPPVARAALDQFRRGYRQQEVNLAEQFGPLDAVNAMTLPRSWRETQLVDLMSRFNSRVGRRVAYHESMEPAAIQDALTDPMNNIGGADPVRNVLDDMFGVRENEEAHRTALSGLVRAAMLGPLTGAKDFVSNLTLGMQHQTLPQSILSPLRALSDISRNIRESFEAGVNRHNISAIEMGEGGITNVANILRRVRDVVSVAQGRNFLEKVTRATAYGQGRFLAMDNLWAAHNNQATRTQLKFLNDFAPGWQQHRAAGQFPPDVLQEAASRYVESVQGTYDYRGLPAIAQKGTVAPYLALSRWNIEKLNNFNEFVINPARHGNPVPLLMSTLGMFIGGEAVNQLVQTITKRKEKTPNYKELQAIAEEPEGRLLPAVVYKLAGLASLSGYGGVAGDLTKGAMDMWFKNKPQSYNNPLIQGLSNIGDTVVDAVEALKEGQLDIGADILSQVMEDFFQSYRLGLGFLSPEKQKQIDRANKLRDLRLFKTTTDLPVSPASADQENVFLDKDVKKFKRTDDMSEAVQLLPELIQGAFESSNGNIDKLRSELRKIKQNNYQTMPSPETMPASFVRFLNRLSQTQGAEAASERLQDYLLQNTVNRVKSSMVPSL